MMARTWWVIDAETDPFRRGRDPQPFAWGAFNGTEYRQWWDDHEGFVAWLAEQDAVVYAHNGGKFDFHFLLPWIAGEVILIHGRIVRAKLGRAELRDSYALLPMPLSAFCKDSIDYALFEADVRQRHKREILEYLESDCRNLYALLHAFHQLNPGMPLTLAAAAFRSWTAITGEKIPRGTAALDAQLRPWYFGGRCQALQRGIFERELQLYDINSAYPAAMSEPHWWGHRWREAKRLPDGAELSTSLVHFTGASRGVLPLRPRKSGALLFPERTGEWHATGHEIIAGLDTGALDIHQVHRVLIPERTESMAPYVDHHWAEKERYTREGMRAHREVSKRMLNSLYGKFAQDPSHFLDWELQQSEPEAEVYERSVVVEFAEGPFAIGTPTPSSRAQWYCVATAASITGAVRAKLWRALHSCVPYYCDTDSILCEPGHSIPVGTGLGAWKHETDVTRAAIAGRKLYALECVDTSGEKTWKTASKGVTLSADEIIRIAQGERITWEAQAPTFSFVNGSSYLTRVVRRIE